MKYPITPQKNFLETHAHRHTLIHRPRCTKNQTSCFQFVKCVQMLVESQH